MEQRDHWDLEWRQNCQNCVVHSSRSSVDKLVNVVSAMKFNEKLEANKRPEWAANYIRYKDLKKLIHAPSFKSPHSAVALAVDALPSTPVPTPVADRRTVPLLGGVSSTVLASLAEPLIDPLKQPEEVVSAAALVAWAVYAKAAHALILGRKCGLAAPPAPPAPDGAES